MSSQKRTFYTEINFLRGKSFLKKVFPRAPFSKTFILKENDRIGCKSKIANRSVGSQNFIYILSAIARRKSSVLTFFLFSSLESA